MQNDPDNALSKRGACSSRITHRHLVILPKPVLCTRDSGALRIPTFQSIFIPDILFFFLAVWIMLPCSIWHISNFILQPPDMFFFSKRQESTYKSITTMDNSEDSFKENESEGLISDSEVLLRSEKQASRLTFPAQQYRRIRYLIIVNVLILSGFLVMLAFMAATTSGRWSDENYYLKKVTTYCKLTTTFKYS